ncbi:MAG: redoxin domain-containing protein [Promethearchaeota archaeon]
MAKNKIKEGRKAPLFSKESYNAGKIDLKEILNQPDTKKVILIFSRYFGCPICMLEFQSLIENKKNILKEGVKLIYITQSKKEVAYEFIKKYDVDFPIIPSTKDELYAEYGLGKLTLSAIATVPKKLAVAKKAGFKHGEYEGYESQCPGQFIINKDGTISHMKKGWLDLNAIINNLT